MGGLPTYWRKPDHTFNPSDYSQLAPTEHYTKKTCLWTGGGFVMPPTVPLPGPPEKGVIVNMRGKGRTRANARSVTPSGFMRAVYNTNIGKDAARLAA